MLTLESLDDFQDLRLDIRLPLVVAARNSKSSNVRNRRGPRRVTDCVLLCALEVSLIHGTTHERQPTMELLMLEISACVLGVVEGKPARHGNPGCETAQKSLKAITVFLVTHARQDKASCPMVPGKELAPHLPVHQRGRGVESRCIPRVSLHWSDVFALVVGNNVLNREVVDSVAQFCRKPKEIEEALASAADMI